MEEEPQTQPQTQTKGPDQWRQATDTYSGKTYFYNHATNETTWTKPEDVVVVMKKKRKKKHTANPAADDEGQTYPLENQGGLVVAESRPNQKALMWVVIFFLTLLIGGAVYHWIEYPLDRRRVDDHNARRSEFMGMIHNNETLFKLFQDYADILDDATPNWDFWSATMFSFTVVTTIGYGTFAPATAGGRAFTVIYALIGIPTAGVALAVIAERALYASSLIFTIGSDKVESAFNGYDTDGSGELDLDEFRSAIKDLGIDSTEKQFNALLLEIDSNGDGQVNREEFSAAVQKLNADVGDVAFRKYKLYIVLVFMTFLLLVPSAGFMKLEGWTYGDSFYFMFVTCTTMGFGDFFPATPGGRALLLFIALLGLGGLAVMLGVMEQMVTDMREERIAKLEARRAAAIAQKQEQ